MKMTYGMMCLSGLVSFAACGAWGADAEQPARDRFHLFLLVGQSNMAGRGVVADQDRVAHPRVMTLSKEDTWVPAADPIHFDKPGAGVGPGRSFGIALAEQNPGIRIGLIPCAHGGSPISTWEPGAHFHQTDSHPYDDAMRRAKRALQDGVLKGILWHQGENDSHPELAAVYAEKLVALIARFRNDLGAPSAPFIIGQMGQWPEVPWSDAKKQVDEAHKMIARKSPACLFVSSDGLGLKADKVHFDAKAQRELGRRFAEAYQEIQPEISAVPTP